MRAQQLMVKSILWCDEVSGQKTVQFETERGVVFSCFVDGGVVAEGSCATIDAIYFLDCDCDRLYARNLKHEFSIKQLSEWDLEFQGRIEDWDGGTALVNCGGLLVPLEDFSGDDSCIGQWIGFTAYRVEFEIRD